MRKIYSALAAIGMALLLAPGPVVADTGTVRTLDRITMNLDHYPTDEDKTILKAIIDNDDSSEEEAGIAMALSNMQQKVKPADDNDIVALAALAAE